MANCRNFFNIAILNSKKGLGALLRQERIDPKKALRSVKYEKRLEKLQEPVRSLV